MVCDHLLNCFALMPTGAIPEQQERLGRVAKEQVTQKSSGCLAGHVWGGERKFMSRAQVDRAVEMDMVALRTDSNHWGLPHQRPQAGGGCLKIQAHLVQSDDVPVGMVLQEIGHFFPVQLQSQPASLHWDGSDTLWLCVGS